MTGPGIFSFLDHTHEQINRQASSPDSNEDKHNDVASSVKLRTRKENGRKAHKVGTIGKVSHL